MKNILLSLVAVAMLALLATPAMAGHKHHRGCKHGYSARGYYGAPYHRRVYRHYYPRPVRYGYYGPPVYYEPYYAPSGFGFSNRNFSFWFGH